MEEKIFVKEKKNNKNLAFIIIVVLLTSFLSSAFTYVILDKNSNKSNNSTGLGSGTIKYELQTVDSPVVGIAAKAGPSIVGIRVKYFTQSVFGTLSDSGSEGSGIIYSEDGYIITNYHVIADAIINSTATITVTFNDNTSCDAVIKGYDSVTDLAVLKVDKTGLTKAEIGKSSDTKVGEIAVAIGNPLGEEFAGSVTVGYISALNRKITTEGRTYNMLQTDAAINSGNSGGALVNSKGQVIGINTAKIGSSGVEGLGFAIPMDEAIPTIEAIIKDGKIVRPYIGISGFNLDEGTAKRYNLVEGVYVQQVGNGTPASKAGVKAGDVVVAIDGTEITTMEKLNEIKNTHKVGDIVNLKIYRNKKYIELKITLEEDTAK